MECIRVKDLTFSYEETSAPIINKMSFSIKQGEFVVLCGPSGCGKSTLLRLLKKELTIAGKSEGEITFFKEGEGYEPHPSKIGYCMQNPDAQIVSEEVWQELVFGLENMGLSKEMIRARVAENAHYFGIDGWFHKKTYNLSGGQKQILNLASILCMEPDILLLDEPTSQLDPVMAEEFIRTVKKLNEQLGITVVMVEHELEEVLTVADRILVMEEGKITVTGTPREVMEQNVKCLSYSMPSAVTIYHGMKKGGACPFTEREGRAYIAKNPPVKKQVAEKKPLNGTVLLETKELCYRYSKDDLDVVHDVSLKIKTGGTYAILGGNGAGKTTLLSLLCGSNKPYSGHVLFQGKKLKQYKNQTLYIDGMAYLPQDPRSLFVRNTCLEDFMEMSYAADVTKEELMEKINDLAKKLRIEKLLNKHPYDLSGGEIQRAGLLKVLLQRPKLLLLDEPTKGLDGMAKEELRQILLSLKENGITILLVTHDVNFAAKTADRCGLFFDHQIITMDSPHVIFGSNRFFTTQASRMAREYCGDVITCEEVIACYQNS